MILRVSYLGKLIEFESRLSKIRWLLNTRLCGKKDRKGNHVHGTQSLKKKKKRKQKNHIAKVGRNSSTTLRLTLEYYK